MRHALAAFLLILLATGALAAVETTTIQGKVYTAGGAAATGGSITCTLSDSGSTADGASSARVASRVVLTIEADGDASGQMVPNDAITPSGTYYTCRFSVTGPISSSWTEKWQVDTTPDPVAIGSITRLEVAPGLTVGDYLEYVSSEPSGSCSASESPKQALDTGTTCSCVASSWSCIGGGGGTPGGNSGEVQLNIGGSFAGDADLTWDGTNSLTVAGKIVTPAIKSTGSTIAVDQNGDGTLDMTLDVSPSSRPRITTTGTLALEGQTGVRIGADAVSGEEWFFDSYYLQSDTDALAGMRVSGDEFRLNVDFDNDSTATAKYSFWVDNSPNMEIRSGQLRGLDQLRLVGDGDADGTGEAIEFDVDGDETAEMGLGRTQLLPDAADGPKYPAWDLDLDGTKDLFWDDVRGIVRPDGTPWNVRGLPVISFEFNRHNNTAASDLAEWQRCAAAGIPCGYAIQHRSQEPSYGYQSSDISTARSYGMVIGTHTNSHCVLGWPDVDYFPEFSSQYGMFLSTLAVLVTSDGISNTITSSSIPSAGYEFSDNCLGRDMDGDGTLETGYSPIGAHVVIDTDGDGTLEFDGSDFESYVTAVPTVGSSPANQLTLAAVPPACTNCKFQIYSGPRLWKNDYETTCSQLETEVGDSDYSCNWFGGPTFMTQDYQASMVAGFGGLFGGSGSFFEYKDYTTGYNKGAGITSMSLAAGSPFDVSAERMLVSCGYDYASVKALIDTAVASGRSIYFNGHPAGITTSTCIEGNGFGDSWNVDALTSVFAYCRTLMAEGKAICADPVTAMRLQKIAGDSQSVGTNLLGNPDFELLPLTLDADGDGTSVAWTSGYYPSRRWPWFDMDSDGTYDAHINDTTTDEWQPDGTISGVGEMDWDATTRITTITRGANTDTRDISQAVRLHSGYYQTSLWVTTDGFANSGSVGIRTCLNLLPRIAGNGNSNALSPRWSVYLEGDSVGLCSDYVRGSRDRVIRGDFYVPPELDGATVEYIVQWTGAGTTIQMRDASLIRYYPANEDSRLGGYAVVPRKIFTGHPLNESGYAVEIEWHPNDLASGQASASQTAGAFAVDVSRDGTAQVKAAIDSKFRFATDSCVSLGDADNTANAACLCRDSSDRIWSDEDCDSTLDLPQEKILNEKPYEVIEDFYDCMFNSVDSGRRRTSSATFANTNNDPATDPQDDTGGTGMCYWDVDTNAGYALFVHGFAPFALVTDSGFYKVGKMETAKWRLNPDPNTWKRALLGYIRTATDGNIATKTNGMYFWCSPQQDVDGDGTAGDTGVDGTCEDSDDCNWYAVTMNGATDAATLVGNANTTATNMGVSCTADTYSIMTIQRNSNGNYTFSITNGAGTHLGNSPVTISTNAPDDVTGQKLSGLFAWMDDPGNTANARMYLDWAYYKGKR